MPCCEAARVWQILGAALQLIGTFVALWALVGLHRDFGQGDLWPAWSNFWRGVRRMLRRGKNVRVMTGTAHGTVSATGTLTGRAYAVVPESPSADELAEWLRRRIAQVQEEINEVRANVASARADLGHRIAQVEQEARNADAQLDAKLVRAMTDRIRAEVGGLFLVVIGTAISAAG
jgi:hypothetical protein